MKYKFWSIVHNAIAHPLLCFNDAKSSIPGRFHDWTANKMAKHEPKPVEEKWIKERDTQAF